MTRLFPDLLGADFERLPEVVRRVHAAEHSQRWLGSAAIERGRGWRLRALGTLAGLPPAGTGPLTVQIARDARGESWVREFAAHRMASRLRASRGLLVERLGAASLAFRLSVDGGALHWQLVAAWGGPLPLPVSMFEGTHARVFDDQGRYAFEVHSGLRGVGRIVHYRGWLDRLDTER